MQRVTITLDDDLVAEIDALIERRGYQNRSEAIRDLARAGLLESARSGARMKDCVGALIYVYEHSARELPKRLVRSFHEHHDLSLATMHVHLDHDNCMELTVLRGDTAAVEQLAEQVIVERGVRYGRLVLVPVNVESQEHAHGETLQAHAHMHVKPGG